MPDDAKKNWTAHLPGILTGSAALIAALTTVFINVRNNKTAEAAVVQSSSLAARETQTPGSAKPTVSAVPASRPQSLELRLARIRIDNDGTLGSTDWTFDIQSGGRSLFSVPFKALTDKAGQNLVTPSEPGLARATLAVTPDKAQDIVVRGWKQNWIGKADTPDVLGKAQLNADGSGLVIEANSDKSGGPAFVLYFNTFTQK